MFHNPDWENILIQKLTELNKKPERIKKLNLAGIGMNWGVWHHHLSKLFEPFEGIEEIDLSNNYIDTNIIDFSKFYNLKKINLSDNALYYWSQEDSFKIDEQLNAPMLEELDLSNCHCGFIVISQKAIWRDQIIRLNLSSNHFTSTSMYGENKVPLLKIPTLPNLKYLSLKNNKYKYVPKLRYLKSLESLDLSENPLKCNFQELLQLKSLKKIILRSIGLNYIPKAIFELKDIESVDLEGNKIPEFEIKRLRKNFPNTEFLF